MTLQPRACVNNRSEIALGLEERRERRSKGEVRGSNRVVIRVPWAAIVTSRIGLQLLTIFSAFIYVYNAIHNYTLHAHTLWHTYIQSHTHARTHSPTNTPTHTYTPTRTPITYKHTYTHLHTHTHTHMHNILAWLILCICTIRRPRHSSDTVPEFHVEAPQATVSERLVQGPHVAAIERESNLWSFGRKASTLPMRHHIWIVIVIKIVFVRYSETLRRSQPKYGLYSAVTNKIR